MTKTKEALEADIMELQMAANIADTFHGRNCIAALDRIEAALTQNEVTDYEVREAVEDFKKAHQHDDDPEYIVWMVKRHKVETLIAAATRKPVVMNVITQEDIEEYCRDNNLKIVREK